MPDTYVQMPDNSYIQFPAGTPDDVINRVAHEYASKSSHVSAVPANRAYTKPPPTGIGASMLQPEPLLGGKHAMPPMQFEGAPNTSMMSHEQATKQIADEESYRNAYLNTDNENANKPRKMLQQVTFALADPNSEFGKKVFKQLASFSPVGQRAILRRAHEMVQVDEHGNATFGGQGVPEQLASGAFGPAKGASLMKARTPAGRAVQTVAGLADPSNVAPIVAGAAFPPAAPFIGAGFAGQQLGESAVAYKQGDKEAAAYHAALGMTVGGLSLLGKANTKPDVEVVKPEVLPAEAPIKARSVKQITGKPNPKALPPSPKYVDSRGNVTEGLPEKPATHLADEAAAETTHKANLLKQEEAARTAQENAEAAARRAALDKAAQRGKKALAVEQSRQASAERAKAQAEKISARDKVDADYAAWTREEPTHFVPETPDSNLAEKESAPTVDIPSEPYTIREDLLKERAQANAAGQTETAEGKGPAETPTEVQAGEPEQSAGQPKAPKAGQRGGTRAQRAKRGAINLPDPDDIARFYRAARDKAKQFGYGMKPVLSGINQQAEEAATEHDSAGSIANVHSTYRIPKVTDILAEGYDRSTPVDLWGRFQTYGTADRMAAERDRVRGEIAKSTDPAEIKKYNDQLRDIALERAKNPLEDPVSGNPITESMVKNFMADPIVQRAVDAHKAHIEPILEKNQLAQGGVTTGVRGKYSGAYFPAVALDDTGAPAHGSGVGGANSAGRNSPLAQLGGNTSDQHFTGTGHTYESDYESVVRDKFKSGFDRATERQMHQTFLDKNIERPLTVQAIKRDASGNPVLDKSGNPVMQNVANPTLRKSAEGVQQMNTGTAAKPNWERAHVITLQPRVGGGLKYQRLKTGKYLGTIDETIPSEVALPTRVWNEIKPLFDKQAKSDFDQGVHNIFSHFMEKYLTGFSEVNAHMLAQGSNVTHAKRFLAQNPASAAIPSMLQVPVEFVRNFSPNRFDLPTKQAAMQEAAKAGIVPPDWPFEYRDLETSTNKVADAAWNVAHASRHKLYGVDGVVTNAATSIYTYWKDAGLDRTPRGQELLHDAFRFLNTFGEADDATLQKVFRSVGAGTFYRTGIKNQTAALKAGKMVFAAGLAGNVVAWTAGFKAADEKHRWPTEVPGARLFDIPITGLKSKDGGQVYINLGFTDRSLNYGAKRVGADTVMEAMTDKMHFTQAALQFAANEINVRMPLATSGPLPGAIESLTGNSTYLVPNEKLTGLKNLPSPSSDYAYTDIKRWVALLQAELPISSTGYSMQGNRGVAKIKNTKAQALNAAMKALGMGQLHVSEPAGYIKAHQMQAERANLKLRQAH